MPIWAVHHAAQEAYAAGSVAPTSFELSLLTSSAKMPSKGVTPPPGTARKRAFEDHAFRTAVNPTSSILPGEPVYGLTRNAPPLVFAYQVGFAAACSSLIP